MFLKNKNYTNSVLSTCILPVFLSHLPFSADLYLHVYMCISGHVSFEKIDIFSISETWLKDYSMCQLKCFYDQKKQSSKTLL